MLPLVPTARPQANVCRSSYVRTYVRRMTTYKPQLTSSSVGQARPNYVHDGADIPYMHVQVTEDLPMLVQRTVRC